MRQVLNREWNRVMDWTRPIAVSGMLTALGVLAGLAASLAQTNEGELGTRVVLLDERPVRPGMPVQSETPLPAVSPGQPDLRPPKFPQQFNVQGPEVDSVGFAVTRPGPVVVDVRAQGAPIIVTLQSPGGQPIVRQGDGNVRLDYNVTPDDVQRSLFWAVQVRSWCEDDCRVAPERLRSAGSIRVQHPPVDQVTVQQAVNALAGRQKEPSQGRRLVDPNQAKSDPAAFNRELQNRVARIAAEQAASRGEAIRQVEAANTRLSGEQVVSRAVVPQTRIAAKRSETLMKEVVPQPPPAAEPPAQTRPIAPPVEVAPPEITGITPAAGQPGIPLLITGSGFGGTRGEVHFVLNPGRDVVAQVDAWSDGAIRARVPEAKCLVPAQASVYVVARGTPSTALPFGFTPALGARTALFDFFTPGTTIASPGGVYPSASLWYVHPFDARAAVKHQSSTPFFGHKGTDVFLQGVALSNGWVLEDVQLATFWWNTGKEANAYVLSLNKGSNLPVIQVRWWTNAFDPFVAYEGPEVAYTFAAVLKGPADMPDGLVNGTPCQ